MYEKEKKIRTEFDKKKALEDKAKALLELRKEHYLKPELQVILQWKLGPERYAEHSKKNIRELEELWRLSSNEPNPPDVVVPLSQDCIRSAVFQLLPQKSNLP